MNSVVGFIIERRGIDGDRCGSFTVCQRCCSKPGEGREARSEPLFVAGYCALIEAPFYILGKKIHARYLAYVQGAIRAACGNLAACLLSRDRGESRRNSVLMGSVDAHQRARSSWQRAKSSFAQEKPRWLPWLALPIGSNRDFIPRRGALETVLMPSTYSR